MPNIGIPELIVVLVILLVIFGPKRLPGLGRSLGGGMREFKESISGTSKHDDDADDELARPRLERASEPITPAAAETVTPAETVDPAPERERVPESRA
jgi:sec-independent protein translocase protein TatA